MTAARLVLSVVGLARPVSAMVVSEGGRDGVLGAGS